MVRFTGSKGSCFERSRGVARDQFSQSGHTRLRAQSESAHGDGRKGKRRSRLRANKQEFEEYELSRVKDASVGHVPKNLPAGIRPRKIPLPMPDPKGSNLFHGEVGDLTSDGTIVRRKEGTSRPPYIPAKMWITMCSKGLAKTAVADYEAALKQYWDSRKEAEEKRKNEEDTWEDLTKDA